MKTHSVLMIQTPNKKKYFTEVVNLPKLVKFAQIYGAELSLVESPEVETIPFETLATAFCDESYHTPRCRNIKVLRQIYPEVTRERSTMIENARLIRKFIRSKLQRKEVLQVKDVKYKFGKLKLSAPCISNHITAIRREMKKSGLDVIRIKAGSYRLC